MRPEGGEFALTDPVATEESVSGVDLLIGGTFIHVTAKEFVRVAGDVYVPTAEQHLRSPNITFGRISGATWEDPSAEGLARIINAAYWVDGVLFSIRVHIQDDDRPASVIRQDAELVYRILATVTPY